MYDYVIAGLAVRSDIALPGVSAAPPAQEAHVVILGGDVPHDLDAPTLCGPTWQLAGDRLLLTIPGIVRLLLTGGREIRHAFEPGVTPAEAAIFISGSGFGILLHQRGRIVLHASAVRVGERAVLFCGPSGAGKSTLAAALVDVGYDLLSDDLCCLTVDPDTPPLVHPDGRQLKLWENAIDRLALQPRKADPVRPDIRKFYVEPRACSPEALPLAALYALREARPPFVSGIESTNVVDGATLIRDNAFRPAMVARMGLRSLYFGAAATIVQQAGCFHLTRELGFARMPGVVAGLEAHWQRIGIAGLRG